MGTEHYQQKQHIVLFPFLGQGHIIPFLQLADLIHRHRPSTTVTLVSTPLNILHLRRTLPSTTPLRLAELPFSSSDHEGLPPGVDNTSSLPIHLFAPFFLATQSLRPSFKTLLLDIIDKEDNSTNVVRVVADMFLGWTVEVAREVGLSHSVFVTFGAYGMATYSVLWLHHHTARRECFGEESDDEMMTLPDFPEEKVHRSLVAGVLHPYTGSEPLEVFLHRQISFCFASDSILVSTAEELEKKGLAMLRRIAAPNVPVWPVGPLLRSPSGTRLQPSDIAKRCVEWLDAQLPASVVYVSFGSQNSVSTPEMMDLATGLEASGAPFIWVFRPPVAFDDSTATNEEGGGETIIKPEWLPEGFKKRIRDTNKGLLLTGWAPQMEILSHKSIGAFLSHCGWNSTVESLSCGVPMIGWPLIADQLYNSKMVTEMGVGVEVSMGMYGGGLQGGWRALERSIRVVLDDGEEGKMRRKAREMKEVIALALNEKDGYRGSSFIALEQFLDATTIVPSICNIN